MWRLLMMLDNYYTGIRVLCAIRDDPNDAVRVPMQRAITRDVLRNKDQMDVSTLVKLVSQATEDAVPNEFVPITTVPEMMYKNWQSNQHNVPQTANDSTQTVLEHQCRTACALPQHH